MPPGSSAQSARLQPPAGQYLPRRLPVWAYLAGLLAAIVALVAAGGLSWQHLTGIHLPGCGGVKQESSGTSLAGDPEAALPACATLDAHPMGSLGGMWLYLKGWSRGQPPAKILPDEAFWPMSFTGTAWFAAIVAAWGVVGWRGRVLPWAVRGLIWLGAVGSIVYLVVIVISHKLCPYCITAHAGNLALLAFMEIGMRKSRVVASALTSNPGSRSSPATTAPRRRSPLGPPVVGAIVFALMSAGLAFGEHARHREAAAKNEAEFAAFQQAMQAKTDKDKAAPPAKVETLPWGNNGFVGRWLLGPKEAKVRVVMITDYQCPDCKRNEGEAMAMYDKYPGKISISAMHFPLCSDCNNVNTNMHPNACWAARAAETAGLLAGNDGFWKMHRWLFEHSGSFTNDELLAGLKGIGMNNTDAFLTVMQTDATLRPVQGDIAIGNALGLFYTPLIFINGVEFRAWNQPGALVKAIEAVIASDPPAQGPQNDRPLLAHDKYINDWVAMPAVAIPPARPERMLGKPEAKVQVVIFGDYTDKDGNSRKVDTLVRALIAKGDRSLAYSFRHYPGDQTCNPTLPKTFFPVDCAAARGAEGAGIMGGPELFWKMHTWLLANGQKLTSAASVSERAAGIGIDPTKLDAAMNSPAASQAVENDVAVAKAVGVAAIPCIYVNGKRVERWHRENDNILEAILDMAEAGKTTP